MSECGSEPFALRVLGDSMEPEFKEGHVIIIDPDAVVHDGAYVFAVDGIDGDEYIFRQLKIEGNQYSLVPLNDNYPSIPISGLEQVHGVIIQGGGLRRSERKSYS
jgi:SOS-response transcriptional repressor LexA